MTRQLKPTFSSTVDASKIPANRRVECKKVQKSRAEQSIVGKERSTNSVGTSRASRVIHSSFLHRHPLNDDGDDDYGDNCKYFMISKKYLEHLEILQENIQLQTLRKL